MAVTKTENGNNRIKLQTTALIATLSLSLSGLACLSALANDKSVLDSPIVSNDAKKNLLQIEKRRREMHERLEQVRKREQLAIWDLRKVKERLNATTGVLIHKKRELKKTEHKIDETDRARASTQTREQKLSQSAARRLREIYEGRRITFVEMFFQMDSLQGFLDRMYYQERIAEQDRKLLAELRAKAILLAAQRGELDLQKRQMGDLVSEFAKKAMAIAKEKVERQQVANRLKTQRAFYEKAERQLAMESQRLETQILEMEDGQKNSNRPIQHGSGNLSMPLKAHITSPFGWRKHPIFGVKKFHTGVDLAGPNRSPIKAADSGSVLHSGWYGGYGKVVIVSHGNGMATLYAHLSRTCVQKGDNVQKGQVIGHEGTTGFSTGPHLHFEVRVNGKPNNPLNYVR